MRLQGMDLNSFFLEVIDHEAIKVALMPTTKNCLSSNGITPKTTETFL